MQLTDNTKLLVRDMMDILQSRNPMVQHWTRETEQGRDRCNQFSDVNQWCVSMDAFMTEDVLGGIDSPVLINASVIYPEVVHSDYSSDREYFVVQVNKRVVFRAMLPNPSTGEIPDVDVYEPGPWENDLRIARLFF